MAKKKKDAVQKTGVDRWREETHDTGASTSKKGDKAAEKGAKRRRPATLVVRRARACMGAAAALIVAAAVTFALVPGHISRGVDFTGGTSATFAATADGQTPSDSQMNSTAQILRSRLAALGVNFATVSKEGSNITVKLPGSAEDNASTIETLSQSGNIEFVRGDDIADAEALAKLNAGTENVKLEDGTYTSFMDGSHISAASVTESTSTEGSYVLSLSFDDEGAQTFADVTGELAENSGELAIVLDGTIKVSASVSSKIEGGQVSVSGFTQTDASVIKSAVDNGSLPVSLTTEGAQAADAVIGTDQLPMAVAAGVALIAVIAIVLFVRLRAQALLPLASLIVYGAMHLGLLSAATYFNAFYLSLISAAAIVMGLAIVLASSIMVLERHKKQMAEGKTVKNAAVLATEGLIKSSWKTDLVIFAAGLVIFFVGTDDMRSFGLALSLAVVCEILTVCLFTGPWLRLLAQGTIQKNPAFWGIASNKDQVKVTKVTAEKDADAGEKPAQDSGEKPADTKEA